MDEHDDRKRRCPRLGHEVPFHYCRTQEGHTVCHRIAHCWWEQFDIAAWLRENLPEQAEKLLEPPRPDKIGSLIDIIEKAKKRKK